MNKAFEKVFIYIMYAVFALLLGEWFTECIRRDHMITDPLIAAGMPEAQVRRYRYLFVLNRHCFPDDNEDPTQDKDVALKFLEQTGMVQCPACHRYYVTDVAYCPDDGYPTKAMSDDAAQRQIETWEAFKRSYTSHTGIKITRLTTIRLCHAVIYTRAS